MDTNENKILYKELSYKVIGLAMEAHRKLGHGFLEKVYENALMILFRKNDVRAEQQAAIKVFFEGEIIGQYVADILIDEKIILELKCAEKILPIHRSQLLNYLKASNLRLGIIINFGNSKLEYERLVY
ncbi:MAG: GxxExxY protein [Desulfobacteraceae bacterium IS3]|nr:MAG: GxxExxY protein [Desulfobacteraceae bacterium IS3]